MPLEALWQQSALLARRRAGADILVKVVRPFSIASTERGARRILSQSPIHAESFSTPPWKELAGGGRVRSRRDEPSRNMESGGSKRRLAAIWHRLLPLGR